jgi:hypothetical protein
MHEGLVSGTSWPLIREIPLTFVISSFVHLSVLKNLREIIKSDGLSRVALIRHTLPRNEFDNSLQVRPELLVIVLVVVSLQFQQLPPAFRVVFFQHEAAKWQQAAVGGMGREEALDGNLLVREMWKLCQFECVSSVVRATASYLASTFRS